MGWARRRYWGERGGRREKRGACPRGLLWRHPQNALGGPVVRLLPGFFVMPVPAGGQAPGSTASSRCPSSFRGAAAASPANLGATSPPPFSGVPSFQYLLQLVPCSLSSLFCTTRPGPLSLTAPWLLLECPHPRLTLPSGCWHPCWLLPWCSAAVRSVFVD